MKLTIDVPIDVDFLENAESSETGRASNAFIEYVGRKAKDVAEDAAEKHLVKSGAVV